jgi:hypothetical protein
MSEEELTGRQFYALLVPHCLVWSAVGVVHASVVRWFLAPTPTLATYAYYATIATWIVLIAALATRVMRAIVGRWARRSR